MRQVVSQQPLPTPPSNYQVRQAECETCVDNGSQSYCADGSCAEEAYVSSDCADGGGYGMCSDGCMGGSCGMFGECGDGCGSGSGWFLDGWSAQGATFNPDNPDDGFNTPVTFNDEANQFQLNQLYLSAGKRTNKCMGWDIGGQVDVLFGSDYFFTQSRGLETRGDFSPHWNGGDGPRAQGAAIYGLALPQLYMEVFAPVGNGINVKIGHFYTILGYESVRAPDNFFYSHAYTMQYGEPFTHTGVLAETSLHPQVLLQGGFTRGWDNWEDNNDDLSFLGGLSLSNACGTSSLAFSIHTGKEDDLGLNNRTVYSVVYSKQIYQRLRYVFQHDFGVEEDAVLDSRFQPKSAKWYGANNYLIMDVNDSLSLATRVEWFRDQDNYRVTPGLPVADGSNFYGITTGANYRFSPKAVLRPELRWDWSDVEGTGFNGVYNTFSAKDQFTFGIDLILSL